MDNISSGRPSKHQSYVSIDLQNNFQSYKDFKQLGNVPKSVKNANNNEVKLLMIKLEARQKKEMMKEEEKSLNKTAMYESQRVSKRIS